MIPAHQIAEKLMEDQAAISVPRGIAYRHCTYDASVMRPLVRIWLFKHATIRGFHDR